MRIATAFLLLIHLSVGNAQEVSSGPYVGVSLANFDYHDSGSGFDILDGTANATKLYGGYRIHENWAVEASWQITNSVEEPFLLLVADAGGRYGGLPGDVSGRFGAEFEVVTVRGVGFLPFSWGALFAGLGYFDGDIDTLFEADNGITFIRAEIGVPQDGVTFLGGAQWDFRAVTLRLEYEWWDIGVVSAGSNGADASALGFGGHWRF